MQVTFLTDMKQPFPAIRNFALFYLFDCRSWKSISKDKHDVSNMSVSIRNKLHQNSCAFEQ